MSVKEDYLVKFGKNIKKLREKKGLSLENLGLEMGLSRMQVHRIESGYNVTITTIIKLALALDVDAYELFSGVITGQTKKDLEDLVNGNKATKLKRKPPKSIKSFKRS